LLLIAFDRAYRWHRDFVPVLTRNKVGFEPGNLPFHIKTQAMQTKLILCATVGLSLLFTGCSKDEGTAPDSGIARTGMSYELRAINVSSGINQKTTAGIIQWTSGFANPRRIKFEAKQQQTKIEYETTNTTQIDLFAPVATSFGGFMLPAGAYKEIELKVKLEKDASEPGLYLAGSYANGALLIPVIFRVDDPLEIKTEVKDVTIDENSSIAAITSLDLASFTRDWSDAMIRAAELTNGTLVISKTSNKSLYKAMLHNLSDKRHKCEFKRHK
jgi:hypothetical protein